MKIIVIFKGKYLECILKYQVDSDFFIETNTGAETMQNISQEFCELRKQFIQNQFKGLNPMQQKAVFTTNGPLLILAGAGSGKTTVLVNRIANLILFGNAYNSEMVNEDVTPQIVEELKKAVEKGSGISPQLQKLLSVNPTKPWNVLAITFTNKAAGELKQRLSSFLGQEIGEQINASTFHSACVRILRRQADKLGFPTSFTIYDSDDQQRVLKEIYKTQNIDDKFLPIKACLSAIGRLKDKMITPAQAMETPADTRSQLIAQVYMAYSKRCKAAGAMDFDDLIYYTVLLLRDFSAVREYYQNRFRYILVDEYQDTSIAQFQLVNLLCDANANICVVGDDDQSIYRFRGATIENILSFEQRFSGAVVIRLEQNYRSTSNILNAANGVIKNNAGRKGKTLWTDNGDGEKIEHYLAENEQDEAAHIVEVIGRHLKEGAQLKDHAVLYRMNAQSSPVENYFTRAGIPYKIVGGLRFNDRKEIKDMHAYMSIIANPQDDLRLRRIINEPTRKIGATTVETIAEIASNVGVPMLEIVRDATEYPALGRAVGALHKFYEIYEQLKQTLADMSLYEFAAAVPEITGYTKMLETQGEEGITRLENIGQLVSNMKTYVDQNGEEASLEGYLEEIALIADIDNYDENDDRVVMMTMHAAKGLEFPYVFIVGLEEGVFPSDMSRWSNEDLEEERRLCYVGITRAKKELILSSAASRLLYGQTRRNPISRFLEEIDPTVIKEEVSARIPAPKMNSFMNFGSPPEPGSDGYSSYLDSNYNKQGSRSAFTSYSKTAPASKSTLAGTYSKNTYTSAGAPKPAGNAGVVFAIGDEVEHKVFGHGIVQKVTPVAGDTIVEIKFDKAGVKKTMANFAPLKKL